MRPVAVVLAVLLLAWLAWPSTQADEGTYTLKNATTQAPKELKDPIKNLLEAKSVQVFDAKDNLHCEIWFRKKVPAKATEDQVKNGLTYAEVQETTILGVIHFPQKTTDYRKQEIKPGVYTLRLASQPKDGDHMGTAPGQDFCLLVAADKDLKLDTMEPKVLHELSAKSRADDATHPGVLFLFPNDKDKSDVATVVVPEGHKDHRVVKRGLDVEVNGKTVKLGIALTVVGEGS